MTMGEKITAARISRSYTAADLAGMIGITEKRLLDFENDRARPSIFFQSALCRVLNISIFYLRNREVLKPDALWALQPTFLCFYEQYGAEGAEQYEKDILKEVRPFLNADAVCANTP